METREQRACTKCRLQLPLDDSDDEPVVRCDDPDCGQLPGPNGGERYYLDL